MWEKKEHDFGNIKGGSKIEYTFIHDRSKIIRGIEVSCPCCTAYHKDNKLRVVWRTNDKFTEPYESHKFITIHYPNEELEILELKAWLV